MQEEKVLAKKERHLLTDKIKNTCVQCKRYPHYRMILYISIITIVSGVLSICLFCSLPAVSALLTSICAGCITGIVFYILANVRNKGDRHHLAPGCVPLRKGRTPPGPAGISAHRRLRSPFRSGQLPAFRNNRRNRSLVRQHEPALPGRCGG